MEYTAPMFDLLVAKKKKENKKNNIEDKDKKISPALEKLKECIKENDRKRREKILLRV